MISFELNKNDDVLEVHLSDDGLTSLIDTLKKLQQSKKTEHIHLMTEDWGGEELSNQLQGENAELVNHVKVMLWK